LPATPHSVRGCAAPSVPFAGCEDPVRTRSQPSASPHL
jgi:hypothetical protein